MKARHLPPETNTHCLEVQKRTWVSTTLDRVASM